MNISSNKKKQKDMKKIIIIDGAKSAGEHIEVKTSHLFSRKYPWRTALYLAPLSTSAK